MKVCDRHPPMKAESTVVFLDTEERVDLCGECLQQIRAFAGGEKKTLEPKHKGILGRLKDSVKPE